MTATKRAERTARRGFATRAEERQARMRSRLASSQSAGQQLSAAYDWFRSAVSRVADDGARSRLTHQMAAALADAAEAAERSTP